MRMRKRGRVLAAEHKATADMAGDGSSSYARISVCRTLTRVIGSIFPLREAVADNFHCSHCSVAQARVAGDLPAHALAFAPKHGVTGTGATDAPGQATTVSMPGMGTSITIPGTIVPPPTRTPRAATGTGSRSVDLIAAATA